MKNGVIHAISAYFIWGFLPIYWKTIKIVPASQIVCHRMIWSLVFVLIVLCVRNNWTWLSNAKKNPKVFVKSFFSASLLGLNWLIYIWAVNSGYLVEASLGYFINPLVNVLLGVLFLSERPRLWQLLAILIAVIGVFYLTLFYGKFPWIALSLGFSFGFYGLLRKSTSLSSLEGLSVEAAIFFVPASLFLVYNEIIGQAAFGHSGLKINLFLIFTGVITAFPLLLFVSAARQISLTTLGILQYILPTMQFLLGVFVYDETVNSTRLIGFSLIWIALFIYSFEEIIERKYASKQVSHKLLLK